MFAARRTVAAGERGYLADLVTVIGGYDDSADGDRSSKSASDWMISAGRASGEQQRDRDEGEFHDAFLGVGCWRAAI